MEKFSVTENTKLVKYLLKAGYTYGDIRKGLRKRDVKVNGARVADDLQLKSGDTVECYFDRRVKTYRTVYVDGNILVVDKDKDIASEQLFELVRADYEAASFIHRLDRNTDGIIVFALNPTAESCLLEGFKTRAFEKYYLCEVVGRFAVKEGIERAYLEKTDDRVYIHKQPINGAVEILTGYRVIEERENSSLLEVSLLTGKTHQIRAHLAFLGHPIVGDGKYGNNADNAKFGYNRQRLTSARLIFHFTKGSPLGYLDGREFNVNERISGHI